MPTNKEKSAKEYYEEALAKYGPHTLSPQQLAEHKAQSAKISQALVKGLNAAALASAAKSSTSQSNPIETPASEKAVPLPADDQTSALHVERQRETTGQRTTKAGITSIRSATPEEYAKRSNWSISLGPLKGNEPQSTPAPETNGTGQVDTRALREEPNVNMTRYNVGPLPKLMRAYAQRFKTTVPSTVLKEAAFSRTMPQIQAQLEKALSEDRPVAEWEADLASYKESHAAGEPMTREMLSDLAYLQEQSPETPNGESPNPAGPADESGAADSGAHRDFDGSDTKSRG